MALHGRHWEPSAFLFHYKLILQAWLSMPPTRFCDMGQVRKASHFLFILLWHMTVVTNSLSSAQSPVTTTFAFQNCEVLIPQSLLHNRIWPAMVATLVSIFALSGSYSHRAARLTPVNTVTAGPIHACDATRGKTTGQKKSRHPSCYRKIRARRHQHNHNTQGCQKIDQKAAFRNVYTHLGVTAAAAAAAVETVGRAKTSCRVPS